MTHPRREVTPHHPSRRATARVPDPMPVPTECPYCAGPVTLERNAVVYGRDYGDWPWLYRCVPCDAYVGLHPFTAIPLGTLATRPMREARKRAKAAFQAFWRDRGMSRSEAYRWASQTLSIPPAQMHVGMFDVEQCHRLIEAVRQTRSRNSS